MVAPPVEGADSHRAATHFRAGGTVVEDAGNGEAGRVAAERSGDLRRPILEVQGISRAALVILRQTAADFRAELVAVGALRRAVQLAADELGYGANQTIVRAPCRRAGDYVGEGLSEVRRSRNRPPAYVARREAASG